MFYLEAVRDSWQPNRLSTVGAVFIKKKKMGTRVCIVSKFDKGEKLGRLTNLPHMVWKSRLQAGSAGIA